MKHQISKCIFGQALSLGLAYANYILASFDDKVCFFYGYSGVYIVILFISLAIMLIKKIKFTYTVPFYYYLITGIFDFTAGYLLCKAFGSLKIYIVIFLTQLIYPMSGITSFIFKLGKMSMKEIIAFTTIVGLCLFMNHKSNNDTRAFDISTGWVYILCALLSNLLYMINTFLQGKKILPSVDSSVFLVYFSLFGLLTGTIVTYVADRPNLLDMKDFYTSNYKGLIFYSLIFGVFYVAASPYIEAYGPIAFNASLLTLNAYIGLFNEFTFSYFLGYIALILMTAGLVLLEAPQVQKKAMEIKTSVNEVQLKNKGKDFLEEEIIIEE